MAEKNIVIVESPAKAKTIEKFLGKDFMVKSSFGHIRDLSKKNFGIDLEKNFEPVYEISPEKKKVVTELKKLTKDADMVWLASDEDREGEAIAWHLYETLNLKPAKTKRIVFHEITKEAILKAVENPREIDMNLVNAQQARRVLDRIVGFELSPVLWKKVKPSLSAGRVQSVAVRLIVEREREIINFQAESLFRVYAYFTVTGNNGKVSELKAELSKRYKRIEEVREFLELCKQAEFKVDDVTKRPTKKSPSAPFTTSTLQQEASRKLGFSVSQTMSVAQKLYESGFITYMRTDSVNLSNLAIATTKSEIEKEFGPEYSKVRNFKTKSKGAQEAHEAIRPTYMSNKTVEGSKQEQRLYELIWKRTAASQMADAQLEKTTVNISISNSQERFVASGEVLIFDGFLKLYIESTDDESENGDDSKSLIPPLSVNQILEYKRIESIEKYSQKPARFTEASLVKQLEELGIGRPSTYAPTISTVQNRGYVVKEDRPGTERNFQYLLLESGTIKEEVKTETFGTEKSKLFPTDIGIVVSDFLLKNFVDIMDYNFTAFVEKEFDEIADGDLIWQKMIDSFYRPFHKLVEHTVETSKAGNGRRELGTDPASGKPVSVRIGRYGPMAQIGENEDEEKPKFASLRKEQSIETITLEEALDLFKLPRDVGMFEDEKVIVASGRFGPYVKHKNSFYSLKKGEDDPMTIELERAIVLIEEKREADKQKHIKSFDSEPELAILNGRWGPYISYKKKNYKIPKTTEPASLELEDCMELIEAGDKAKPKGRKKK
ncbi:MAG: type I DNA topoisomerase [Bacteroidales bacterium]|nr:type I DNA topoisomerase [Bacteroidales bacterium]MCF8455958.1 type I DNA topoisomerase [Bacteroidales bacterium]